MEKILIFDLVGPVAHFRKYFTNSSSLSYGFPPRTVLMGVVAAVLGRERDSYYEELHRGRYAVSIKIPVRRIMQTVNYTRTKNEDVSDYRKLGPTRGTQVPLELLFPGADQYSLCFRVCFSHPDAGMLQELGERLSGGNPFFPLYLGLTEFLARARPWGIRTKDDYQVSGAGQEIGLTSVLNSAYLQKIVLGDKQAFRIFKELVPFTFRQGRVPGAPVSVIYAEAPHLLQVKLQVPVYTFELGDGEQETVAFLD